MLSGQVPFQSSRSFRSADFIMQRITQGDIRFEGQQWESISPGAKDLIKGMSFNCRALLHFWCCVVHWDKGCMTSASAAVKETTF